MVMSDWTTGGWSLFVSIVAVVIGLVIAGLQIRQQSGQAKRDRLWREQDEARQERERLDRLPSLELSFWSNSRRTASMEVEILDETAPYQTDEDLERAAQEDHEALLQTELDDPNADPHEHDEYIDEVNEYMENFRRWLQVNRFKTQCWHLEVQFVIQNTGKVPVSNISAEVGFPKGTKPYIEEDPEEDILDMERPTRPKVHRKRQPVVADDIIGVLSNPLTVPGIRDFLSTPRYGLMPPILPRPVQHPSTWVSEQTVNMTPSEILAGDLWISDPVKVTAIPNADKRIKLDFNLHARELTSAVEGTIEIDIV
jgi:hypothetical protein